MEKRVLRKRKWKLLGAGLIVIGLLVLAYPFSTHLYTYLQQKRLEKAWEKTKEEAKKPVKSPASAKASADKQESRVKGDDWSKKGEGLARLVIPKINLDAIVVKGATPATLRKGPGHIEGTAMPGEKGNIVISGHRTTYGAPFRHLDKLTEGDVIYLYSPTKKYTYNVSERGKKVVKPTDLSVIQPTAEAILTLTTCNPLYSAKERLVIVATLK